MESFKSHILVIDDDEGIRSLLKQFLNENGYLVNTASNALEAKEKISIIKFEISSALSSVDFFCANSFKVPKLIILLNLLIIIK